MRVLVGGRDAPFGSCLHRMLCGGELCNHAVPVHVDFRPAATHGSSAAAAVLNVLRADAAALSTVVPFGHNNPCPADIQPAADPGRGVVKVGIAVLAEDDNGRCLLTQRSAQMRSFANGWVLPGGGVDPGEDLMDTGLRELNEETGLTATRAGMRLFGVWESTFPHIADGREISHHHIVLYLHAKVTSSVLALQASEVQACAWLSRSQVAHMLKGVGFVETLLPANRLGEHWNESVPVARSREIPAQAVLDHVTYGTIFALGLWLSMELEQTKRSAVSL